MKIVVSEGWTTDKVLVFCDTGKLDFPLPVVDAKIKIKITHFETFTNFFAHIVLSPHDFKNKIKELDREIHYLENKKVLNAFHRFHLPGTITHIMKNFSNCYNNCNFFSS